MLVGKIWIMLYALPPAAMAWLLFRVAVALRWTVPAWVYFFLSLGIGIVLGPAVSIVGYGLLDELAGADWLGLHVRGLGAPDPLHGPARQWAVAGGLTGAGLATIVRLAARGGRLP